MKENRKVVVNLLISLFATVLLLTPIFFPDMIQKGMAQPPSTIRIGLFYDIDPIIPNDSVNRSTNRVVQQIFETLIKVDYSNNFKPFLATSWEITSGGKAIIFNLRKGVKFHDGSPFNAKAVKVTFDRMKSQLLKRWSMFAGFLESVEIVNEYVVKMNVKGPPSTALVVLATWGYIESPAAVEKYGKDIGAHPSGTGPFKFVEWVPDQRVVLEANKEYWGGEPKISQLVFKPVTDPYTRLSMLEANDLDMTEDPPYPEIERLKSHPEIKVVDHLTTTLFVMFFNTVKPPFNDKRVRQAISYGIDRKNIAGKLMLGLVPPAETYAGSVVKLVSKYDIYPYNPEKAKSILTALGWNPGKSGFLEKDGGVFRTGILAGVGRPRQIAEAIQAQLKKVGIDVKVIVLEGGTYIKALYGDQKAKQNADFGMMLMNRPFGPDPDSAFNQHFHSNAFPPNASNCSIFSNSELDRLLDEGAKEVDETKRSTIYKRVQDILNEEIPMLPLYINMDFLVLRKGLQGVSYPNAFIPFYEVSKDTQWAR